MTNQEVLDIFVSCATLDCEHCNMSFRGCEDSTRFNEMRDMVISALEKQVAKKPIKDRKQEIRYTSSYSCPSCGDGFTGTGIADYCYHCGQKLDWSVGNE